MTAVEIATPGGPEVLRAVRRPVPRPGPGEVLVKIRGGSEAYLAWSAEPIPKGATVLVINNRGARTVDVSAWTDPLAPLPDDISDDKA